MRNGVLRMALLIFSLAPATAQSSTTLRTIEGVVFDVTTSGGSSEAVVKVEPGQMAPVFVRCDGKGHFIVVNVPIRGLTLSVRAPGYLPRSGLSFSLDEPKEGVKSSFVKTTVTTDDEGRIHMVVSIPLMPSAAIRGRVSDPEGFPIEGCDVNLMKVEPAGTKPGGPLTDGRNVLTWRGHARTNDKGEYRAGDLEPGTYYVVANKGRFATQWETDFRSTIYPGALDFASAKSLEVSPGRHLTADVRIARQKGVRVGGKIVLPAGAVPPRAKPQTTVMVTPEVNLARMSTNPTATGTDKYELADLQPGRYVLSAITRDLSDAAMFHKKGLFGMSRTLEITRDMDDVDLSMKPLQDLNGVVDFSERCRQTPIRIRALSLSGQLDPGQVEADAGPDGKFVLRGITAGTYAVFVNCQDVASMKIGDRDVQSSGFEAPLAGDDVLRIVIGGGSQRRTQ